IVEALHGFGLRARALGPQPRDVHPKSRYVLWLQVPFEGGHLDRCPLEEERGERVRLEAPADAMLDPLPELGAVPNDLRKVRPVPGRDVSFPRARIRARQPAARAVATHAPEIVRPLQSEGDE